MSSATPGAVTVGATSGRDGGAQPWSFQTTDSPDSDGVEGPMVILRSAAGHEFVLTGQDLLMLSILMLLFADTLLTVAEVLD